MNRIFYVVKMGKFYYTYPSTLFSGQLLLKEDIQEAKWFEKKEDATKITEEFGGEVYEVTLSSYYSF